MPVIRFDRLFGGSGGATATAVTEVRAARSTEALLHLSTSQTGACRVNGRLVITDATATGLQVSEHCIPITLDAGWNRIAIEANSHWAGEWAAWAALTTPGGEPVVLEHRTP
jgi:hypothetical protein